MHDSATAIVSGRDSSAATCSSIVVPSRENRRSPWRSAMNASERVVVGLGARAQSGSPISISPRRRQVVISSASSVETRGVRRAQRVGDLGLRDPEQAHDLAPVDRSRRRSRAGTPRSRRRLPHRLQLARRSGQHDDRRARVPSARRHDQPGRGADRLEHGRAARDHRLLAVGRAERLAIGVRASAASAAPGSRRSAARARSSSTISRPQKPPTISAVRSSAVGPRPPLVTITRHPGARMCSSAREQVLGTVADDLDHRGVDAELAQPLGQPRPVAVGDDAGQHLGAGDEDPGAHGARGR